MTGTITAPIYCYPELSASEVSKIRVQVGDLTIATQLNEDRRVVEVMFCEEGIFFHGDNEILLHIKDVDVRYPDGLVMIEQILSLLGISKQMLQKIRRAAVAEGSTYEIVAKQVFRASNSPVLMIERIVYGSRIRQYWTWRKV